MAGGEGHEGHRFAADYMAQRVRKVVWGVEQESYFRFKQRGGSFLPLPVRLSMWHYHPSVHTVTVLPQWDGAKDMNEHYDSLFEKSGAEYYFADSEDPYLNLKVKRGRQGIDTIIPHLNVPSTSDRVKKAVADTTMEDFYNWHNLRITSLEDTVFVP